MKANSLSAWILAVRPYSLGNSVILILVAAALAWTDGIFHWLPSVLCLLFAVLMQCTANLVNDLWDYMKGADQPDRLGPDRAFAKGYITLRAMKAGIAAFTVASCAAGLGILLWAMRHNIETQLGIDGSNLEFVSYRILPTERNAPYLEEGKCVRVGIFKPRILMELTTGCLETTSNRLFDEYVVERGVGEKDLAEKTYRLLDYLFHLRNLEDPGWE